MSTVVLVFTPPNSFSCRENVTLTSPVKEHNCKMAAISCRRHRRRTKIAAPVRSLEERMFISGPLNLKSKKKSYKEYEQWQSKEGDRIHQLDVVQCLKGNSIFFLE